MLPKYGHARQGILMHNLRLLLLTLTFLLARISSATELKPSTIAAFDHYVELAEQRMKNEVRSGPFLSVDGLPIAQREGGYSQLKQGVILTHALEITDHGNAIGVPDGLIHHWVGTAFIPGVTLEQTVTLLHDYNNHWKIFAPEVVRSRLLQSNGKDFIISLRLRKKTIITVTLDTTYQVHYVALDNVRAYSSSYSTKIAEVEHAGEPNEHEKPVGNDTGYMWRLNSYWRYWQRDGGVYIQLEAISLSRDIPTGLGWIASPFIKRMPRESLVFTLSHTRDALTRNDTAVKNGSVVR